MPIPLIMKTKTFRLDFCAIIYELDLSFKTFFLFIISLCIIKSCMSDVGFCKFVSKATIYNLRWLVVTVTQQEKPVLSRQSGGDEAPCTSAPRADAHGGCRQPQQMTEFIEITLGM